MISGIKCVTNNKIIKNRFNQLKFPLGNIKLIIKMSNSNIELQSGIDESYYLSKKDKNEIILKADNLYGVMHGLVTLKQLIRQKKNSFRI